VQFYNTASCSARAGLDHSYGAYGGPATDISYDSWVDHVKTTSANKEVKIYMGLAAAPGATYGNMYLSPNEASLLIEKYLNKWPSMFGGVMLWEATFSDNNRVNEMSYVQHIKKALGDCSPISYPSPTSSAVSSSMMSSQVGPIGSTLTMASSSAEHSMSSAESYSYSSMEYSSTTSEHYPTIRPESSSSSSMEYSTASSEEYPASTSAESTISSSEHYHTLSSEEHPASISAQSSSASAESTASSSLEHSATSSEQHPASATSVFSSMETTGVSSSQVTSGSSFPQSSLVTSYTNTIDGATISSTSSASASASPSSCGVKGFDKSPAYNFLNDAATANFEKCSARCSADPVCVSFAFGLTQCLLYTQSV
jgi:chitinase